MSERILVTGGAGYIGSILVPMLVRSGYEVTVLDSFMYRQTPLLDYCSEKNMSLIRGNVCDESLMDALISKSDLIIPLASIVGAPACMMNPMLAKAVNYDSYISLVAKTSPSQKIIFPMTNSGYGIGEAGQYCTEESPLRPISDYGKAKVEVEKALLDKGNAITFRLATVFGMSPRMRIDLLVNDFVYRAVKDKFIVLFEEHFRRNYIHIKDVASTFVFGIESYEKMEGQPYNVGISDANLSKRQLCEVIQRYLPDFFVHSANIGKDPNQRDYLVSNQKIELLGWKAKYSLDDGITELIKGYQVLTGKEFVNV